MQAKIKACEEQPETHHCENYFGTRPKIIEPASIELKRRAGTMSEAQPVCRAHPPSSTATPLDLSGIDVMITNRVSDEAHSKPPGSDPIEVTIIVPCYNEADGLLHLREKLVSAAFNLEPAYAASFLLVDDGSTDGTWELMQGLFANRPRWTLIRHPANRGIGAAIWTGIRAANTEIVCSIDADCSYDPCQLDKLIPRLGPGVALVTASPYHPAGAVIGVSRRRVFLSKVASFLYRKILRQKLYTYTSCFRVYRRSSILRLSLWRHDFLAIPELVGKLDLKSAVVVECPAALTARAYGGSKMKTLGVLLRHLHLMTELLGLRISQTLFADSGT